MLLHALILAAATQPCANANTQTDLNICWDKQAKAADAELNARYAKVKAQLKGMGIDPNVLTGPELAWIKARDATCAFESSLEEGGTIAGMEYSMCVYRMTNAQTGHLQSVVEILQAEGFIGTPKPASAASDAELNRVYKALMSRLDAKQQDALAASENAWIAYRDKWCKLEGYDCKTRMEEQRTQELKDGWIAEPFW